MNNISFVSGYFLNLHRRRASLWFCNYKTTTNQTTTELSSNNTKPVLATTTDLINNHTNENTQLNDINSIKEEMASISVSSSSSTTTTSPVLENYLLDLKKVIEWLVASEQQLSDQSEIGEDVNNVEGQFQTHEVGFLTSISPNLSINHHINSLLFLWFMAH